MKTIKNYLLTTMMVLAPAILLAHPGHEHHGTGMELLLHSLVSLIGIAGFAAGLFYLVRFILNRRRPADQNHR